MECTKSSAADCDSSKCAVIKGYLSAYCANELDPVTKKEVEEHIASCKSCRADFTEYKRVLEVLLSNATNEMTVPHTISPRKRKRMVWLMERPFFAFCVVHHRLTAIVVALTTIVLIMAALFTIKVLQREKPVSAPVTIVVEDPAAELPELDPEQPIPME